MRSWFILFATTFTITTLTLTINSMYLPLLPQFNDKYIILFAISSALCTSYISLTNRILIQSFTLKTTLDITGITLIVYMTGLFIQFIPNKVVYFSIVFIFVTIVYFVIILIYLFILRNETNEMNKKIKRWRTKYVDRSKSS